MIAKNKLNTLFIIITVIFCLLILEIGAKIFLGLQQSTDTFILTGDERVYDHKPDISFTNKYGIEVSYNSQGFIASEIKSRVSGTLRILAIGDSVTESLYLSEGQRYVNILGTMLIKNFHKNVEIINGAISGYNTWQESALLKQKGLALKPDLVIVGICMNDAVKAVPAKYINLFSMLIPFDIRDGSKARHFNFLYQRSAFYKIIYDCLSLLVRSARDKNWYGSYLKNYRFDISDAEYGEWFKALEGINDICKVNNIKVLFVIFPLHSQLLRNETSSCQRLEDYLKTKGINFIDTIYALRTYYTKGYALYLKHDIIHPNALGHKIIAESIGQYIINNRILN